MLLFYFILFSFHCIMMVTVLVIKMIFILSEQLIVMQLYMDVACTKQNEYLSSTLYHCFSHLGSYSAIHKITVM